MKNNTKKIQKKSLIGFGKPVRNVSKLSKEKISTICDSYRKNGFRAKVLDGWLYVNKHPRMKVGKILAMSSYITPRTYQDEVIKKPELIEPRLQNHAAKVKFGLLGETKERWKKFWRSMLLKSRWFVITIMFWMILILSAPTLVIAGVAGIKVVTKIDSPTRQEDINLSTSKVNVKCDNCDTPTSNKTSRSKISYVDYTLITQKILAKFGEKGRLALAIAKCESGLNPMAIGDKRLNPKSYGIFQIRAYSNRPTASSLLDADTNINFAYRLSNGGKSWGLWSCFKNKKYLTYMR